MQSLWRFILGALAALAPAGALAASGQPKPLFESHDIIHLTIRGPLGRIAMNAANSKAPADGTLTVEGASPQTFPVKLSARGITRRANDVCAFPPLRIEFVDKPGAPSLFQGQKKLKLVTHCRTAASFQQYMLLEYAAYRMYNVLTSNSFNVRLAAINYEDSTGRTLVSRLGFFIEDVKDVAKRNGLRAPETGDTIPISALSSRDAAREALFQYMIGNLDWSMTAGPPHAGCCHNTKLSGPEGATRGLIPIPYDFDFSGLVDAPYAVPPDGMAVSSVRDRRYRGFCVHVPEAVAVAAEALARRSDLMAVLDETPQLDAGTRRKAAAYLDPFFGQIGSEKILADKLLRNCLR